MEGVMPEILNYTRRALTRLEELGFELLSVKRLKLGGVRLCVQWGLRTFSFLLTTARKRKIERWRRRAQALRADGIVFFNPDNEILSIVFLK